jgi:hypothetical protein
VLALLLASVLAQAPAPELSEAPSHADEAPSKKDAYLASKPSTPARRPARAGQRADKPIWAHNLRTHEIRALTGPSGIAQGQAGQADRSEFFRCWFTHGRGPIPDTLVTRIVAAAEHFEVREVQVISGFRHPKYNLMLRKKGREVASGSEHTSGSAIDFLLPGIETRPLYEWLLANHDGGVGFYPVSEFVHVDIGRKRTWKGS